jgi:para-nitrobenzyl esterase
MLNFRAFVCVFSVLLPAVAAIQEPVSTQDGLVSGTAGANPEVRVFKGIPYAAPPVGDLRWRGPKAAAAWTGVRAADRFAKPCMQGGATSTPGSHSEDCLYLNVYTAAKSSKERLPVMVWIHGGALKTGAGSDYDGEELARKGVVVVTINYRLGMFGFFAHPELTKESDRNASGNYGLQDQIAALEWVQRNAAAFGGDTKRVTIFGESAGSWSVNYLMATPLARGLFQRAIGESGGDFDPARTLADAEQMGAKFGQSNGAPTLASLRAKSADDLQKADGFSGANVDGWLLPEEVYAIFAKGKQNDVPLLIGSNSDEGSMLTRNGASTAAQFHEYVQRRYGPDTAAFLKVYPSQTDTEAKASQAASMRDSAFGWEMRTWARMQTKTGKSKVYLYYFSRVPPGPDSAARGAFHTAEIAYVFNNVNGKSGYVEPFFRTADTTQRPWQDQDRKLADAMSSYWVAFATTGDPNHKGLPKWPAYRTADNLVMGLGDQIAAEPLPNNNALDFMDAFYDRMRKTGQFVPIR